MLTLNGIRPIKECPPVSSAHQVSGKCRRLRDSKRLTQTSHTEYDNKKKRGCCQEQNSAPPTRWRRWMFLYHLIIIRYSILRRYYIRVNSRPMEERRGSGPFCGKCAEKPQPKSKNNGTRNPRIFTDQTKTRLFLFFWRPLSAERFVLDFSGEIAFLCFEEILIFLIGTKAKRHKGEHKEERSRACTLGKKASDLSLRGLAPHIRKSRPNNFVPA